MSKKTLFIIVSIAIFLSAAFFTAKFLIRKPVPLRNKVTTSKQVSHKKIRTTYTKSAPPPVIPAPGPKAATPRIAIVLDDWGQNYGLLKEAIAVGRPLTLAVLPNLPHSRRIADEAYANGLGVMLHMPMQPFSTRDMLEPHTIKVDMSEKQIRAYLDEALASVPHVQGVNNHMGSKATSDLRVMRIVLDDLHRKGYFFVDSNVISTTVGPDVAEEYGIRFTKRDVFIDNEMNKEKIIQQLYIAKKIAFAKGEAVVIGHDRKMTLQAIKEAAPALEKEGIRFVLVKELVQPAGQAA